MTRRETLTISLPGKTKELVEQAARDSGMTVSEYVRQAIFHEIWKDALDVSRRKGVARGRSKGVFTDDDVFDLVS